MINEKHEGGAFSPLRPERGYGRVPLEADYTPPRALTQVGTLGGGGYLSGGARVSWGGGTCQGNLLDPCHGDTRTENLGFRQMTEIGVSRGENRGIGSDCFR